MNDRWMSDEIFLLEIHLQLERIALKMKNVRCDRDDLLKVAKEMFAVLLKKPAGKLWPSEEELSRYCIHWNQIITRAEMRS